MLYDSQLPIPASSTCPISTLNLVRNNTRIFHQSNEVIRSVIFLDLLLAYRRHRLHKPSATYFRNVSTE